MNIHEQRIDEHLHFLYSRPQARRLFQHLQKLMESSRSRISSSQELTQNQRGFTEKDVALITYGDQVHSSNELPLRTLSNFLGRTVSDVINILHILPFFPYSSDDGFSVKDYFSVNPEYGSWKDISRLGAEFDLMFDAVINHVSRESEWFTRYQNGDPNFEDFFIEVDDSWDLSGVVRPRDNPLVTRLWIDDEEKSLWTTFTSDQIDLNYSNPEVLEKIVEVLLFYVERGASIIRLDAVAYIWKKSGTSCIHLKETHRLVRVFRAVLDNVAPWVALITETNVPHEQNVSYFGDGRNQAQMVYQFPLPPLVLDAFNRGDSSPLTRWANDLEFPPSGGAFFNFLASHDGIGLRPVEGILPDRSIDRMVEATKRHGGYVSYKSDQHEGKSPYELNISYFDALSDPKSDESFTVQIQRFIASQAIMLAFKGVPGIYFHSLFGSRNWKEGVKQTGRKRSINREKLELSRLNEELDRPDSLRAEVLSRYKTLLGVRKDQKAFHPSSNQKVFELSSKVFAVLRRPEQPGQSVLCLHNVTHKSATLSITRDIYQAKMGAEYLRDLITGKVFTDEGDGRLTIPLSKYDILWLKGESE